MDKIHDITQIVWVKKLIIFVVLIKDKNLIFTY